MKTTIIAAAAVAGALFAHPASAKDWIENVSISNDGIDAVAVEVRPGGTGYASIKSGGHQFGLRLLARATNGERIVAMKVGMFNGVQYFEHSGSDWNATLTGSAIGNGGNRSVAKSIDPLIGMGKIKWKGKDPVAACNALMSEKLNSGMSRNAVFAKSWTTGANVFFQLDAVATRKSNSGNGQWNIGNSYHERSSLTYRVVVKCLAKPARAAS